MKELLNLASQTIVIERNGFLSLKGNTDTNLYHIKNGSLRVFILDKNEEQIIRFGYPNDIIVSLDSFLTQQPSEFYIQAIKKTTVQVIRKTQIENFLTTNENKHQWTKILEDLIIQQMEREIDILTNSPKDRYERVLKRSPKLFQEIPSRYIANYLRMSPETLSRLKKS